MIQIGNAVAPPMAAAIGQELRKSIVEKMKRDNNNNVTSSPIKTITTKENIEEIEKVEPMKETEE